MKSSQFDKVLDYFPILAYAGFYFQGAVVASIQIGDPRYMWLGLVTTPAVVAMVVAVLKIRQRHRKAEDEQGKEG